jgi:hypothetical protein
VVGRSESRASASGPEDDSAPGSEVESSSGGSTSQDARKPFLLRLPAPLMGDLRSWAAQDVRSLNGQIEYLLREAVEARRKGGSRS